MLNRQQLLQTITALKRRIVGVGGIDELGYDEEKAIPITRFQ